MSTIVIRPIAAATVPVSQSAKLHKPKTICAKRLNFLGQQLDFQKSLFCATEKRNENTLTGFSGVLASRRGEDNRVQEPFSEGSLLVGANGIEAALNSLSKWLLAALWGAVFLWRHDAETLWAAMGAIINVIISVVLKEILNHERPISTLKSDPGMPSSHAQTIFYTITFLNLLSIERLGLNIFTATLSALLLILGSYFAWLRISHQFHTVGQVIVGAVLGFIFSVLWLWSWNTFVLNLFESSLWVRTVVVVSAFGFIIGFLFHVFQSWIMDEA